METENMEINGFMVKKDGRKNINQIIDKQKHLKLKKKNLYDDLIKNTK